MITVHHRPSACCSIMSSASWAATGIKMRLLRLWSHTSITIMQKGCCVATLLRLIQPLRRQERGWTATTQGFMQDGDVLPAKSFRQRNTTLGDHCPGMLCLTSVTSQRLLSTSWQPRRQIQTHRAPLFRTVSNYYTNNNNNNHDPRCFSSLHKRLGEAMSSPELVGRTQFGESLVIKSLKRAKRTLVMSRMT